MQPHESHTGAKASSAPRNGASFADSPDVASASATMDEMSLAPTLSVREALAEMIAAWMPGAQLLGVRLLGIDEELQDDSTKAAGYGHPLVARIRRPDGEEGRFVIRTASANEFGHDRRADRAAAMMLAYDSFNDIPEHIHAVHLGAIATDGRLVRLDGVRELFLMTDYAEGHTYAEELRAIGRQGHCSERDIAHAKRLGRYLAELHVPMDRPHVYRRALRDLIGDGEGIFGLTDAYPPGVPVAPPERLLAIELACVKQRWRWRDRSDRLVRTHGDFHPFNLLFDDASRLTVLDASRGCAGDAADDVVALSINYLFFALQHRDAWQRGYRPLWRAFWDSYGAHRTDRQLLEVAPMYFAWRALVLSSPRWYPHVDDGARDRMLGAAEGALAAGRLDLQELEGMLS